jgi:hypothetical protein
MEHSTSFIRYLRLYTLHSLEQSASNSVYLQTRVATLRYVLSNLPKSLDVEWRQDTNLGINAAQDIITPRFEQLLAEEDIWRVLHSDGQASELRSYWGLRQASTHVLPTIQTLSPRPSVIRSITPTSQNKWMQRIYQAERWLDVAYKTIEVANLGLQFWQNWKIGREQQRLLQDQRWLLKDSVQATVTGQQVALGQASDPSFVQHYLLEHGDDDVYDVLFEDDSATEDKEK